MEVQELELIKALQRQMVAAEEYTIRQVIEKKLGRPATIEDAKACGQILSDPWNGTYILTYKGEEWGVIRYITDPDKFRVEFHPIEKLN